MYRKKWLPGGLHEHYCSTGIIFISLSLTQSYLCSTKFCYKSTQSLIHVHPHSFIHLTLLIWYVIINYLAVLKCVNWWNKIHGTRKIAAEEPINKRNIKYSISIKFVIYLYGDGYPARNKRIWFDLIWLSGEYTRESWFPVVQYSGLASYFF